MQTRISSMDFGMIGCVCLKFLRPQLSLGRPAKIGRVLIDSMAFPRTVKDVRAPVRWGYFSVLEALAAMK
jgi:hypothetical protein